MPVGRLGRGRGRRLHRLYGMSSTLWPRSTDSASPLLALRSSGFSREILLFAPTQGLAAKAAATGNAFPTTQSKVKTCWIRSSSLEVLVSYDTRNPPRLIGAGGSSTISARSCRISASRSRSRRRRGVAIRVRGAPKRLFTAHRHGAEFARLGRRSHTLRVNRRSCHRPRRLRHQGRGRGPDRRGAEDPGRRRIPVQQRRGRQTMRAASPRSWPATMASMKWWSPSRPLRSGAGASRHRLGADAFSRRGGARPGANALQASALHQAMRLGANALDFVESESHQRFGGLTGLRFNIGRVDGGIRPI